MVAQRRIARLVQAQGVNGQPEQGLEGPVQLGAIRGMGHQPRLSGQVDLTGPTMDSGIDVVMGPEPFGDRPTSVQHRLDVIGQGDRGSVGDLGLPHAGDHLGEGPGHSDGAHPICPQPADHVGDLRLRGSKQVLAADTDPTAMP